MTIEKRIDEIYTKMFTSPLSSIIPLILPISLELRDYEGYCILSYWNKPFSKETSLNTTLLKEMKRVLGNEGINTNEIDNLHQFTFIDYLKLRSVDNDQVLMLSAKEMEDRIKALGDLIGVIEPPQGLAPVDLYFRSEQTSKQKIDILDSRRQIEQQYTVLQSYISSKLTEYKRKAEVQERKSMLEKGIRNSKDIFIIHGHNEAKRRELEALLKNRFNLNPIVLSDQPDQGLTIIEKFEKHATNCSYAFALFTPDDIVASGDTQYFQARPNVIFELGWFYANLGRSRVCILDQVSEQSKIFSDLQGIMRMQFTNNISERIMEIERELKSVGLIP